MSVSLEFLGSGTSSGIPVVACDCHTCTSPDPRDTRLRASAVIRTGDTTLLIDTSPDFRYQALRSNLRHIDAVLMTHTHADHTAGMDELRRFNAVQQMRIPMYAPENAAAELRNRFAYIFEHTYDVFGYKPDADLIPLRPGDGITVHDVPVTPIPLLHGRLPIFGYRVGNLAYLTDVKTIPDSSWDLLDGVDTLVIGALRHFQHPTHMTVDEALATIERMSPRVAYLTHIGHDMGRHAEVQPTLPDNVFLAEDGLVLTSS